MTTTEACCRHTPLAHVPDPHGRPVCQVMACDCPTKTPKDPK